MERSRTIDPKIFNNLSVSQKKQIKNFPIVYTVARNADTGLRVPDDVLNVYGQKLKLDDAISAHMHCGNKDISGWL